MVCKTCADAAQNKLPREEHCQEGRLNYQCDCQHRVPTRSDLAEKAAITE